MKPLNIVHLFPELLNLYGDGGNVIALRRRCEWRNIPVQVTEVGMGDEMDFSHADIVFIGGGADREQMIAKDAIAARKSELHSYVADAGVLLAVCGGYQLLGHYYKTSEGTMEGLSLVDLHTEQGEPRLIDNIVLENEIFPLPIVGFENHGGRTYIGDNKPFGKVLYGHGNNGEDHTEGVLYKNVIGTYLHGPLLPKNPHICDYLLSNALERKYGKGDLTPLDDNLEVKANQYIYNRFVKQA